MKDSETTESARSFGNYYRVYSPTLNKVFSVPTNKVYRTNQNYNHGLSSAFLQENIDISLLVKLFSAISELDINEKRKIRLPLKEYHFITKTFESAHPLTSATDSYTLIDFPGAESVEIKFSSQSSLDNRSEHVMFYKNSNYGTITILSFTIHIIIIIS